MKIIIVLSYLTVLSAPVRAQQGSLFEGFVQPARDVQIAFSEPGLLQQVHVEVGSRVQQGQPLAVLDDELQEAQLRVAQAQAQMQGALQAARAERDLIRLRTERLRELYRDQLARPDELRRAETDLEVANARVLSAEEDMALRQLEVERARMKLNRRTLNAPFDGVVTKILREAGEFISPNEPVLLRLITADQMVAVINVPAEIAPQVAIGQSVEVLTTAPPTTFKAKVRSVSPSIDGGSGTVEIRAAFENPGFVCRDGDRCSVSFSTIAAGAQRQPTSAFEYRR